MSVAPEELKSLLAAFEAALRQKGATDEEIYQLKSSVRVVDDEKDEERPLWAQRKFLDKSNKIDFETRMQGVGEFQRRYLDLPTLRVRYRDVTFTAKYDPSEPAIKTIANANPIGAIWTKVNYKMTHKGEPTTRHVLKDISGVIEPGTLTLVIGPPGCGKSSYLKMLAGLLSKKTATATLSYKECSYNGEDLYSPKRKFVPAKLAAYIDQLDIHTPTLTVEETFRFAYDMFGGKDLSNLSKEKRDLFLEAAKNKKSQEASAAVVVGADPNDEAAQMKAFLDASESLKMETILGVLGIEHVRNTIVGNASIRGVSGGQRRRVSVGEMLMGKCRLLLGDEISTGLDSQTTFEITQAFKIFTKSLGITVVLSLLQPPPETFALFDDVVLLNSGSVAYHGPTEGILDHFKSISLVPPDRKDTADFLIEISSSADMRRQYRLPGIKHAPNDLAGEFVDHSEHYANIMSKLDVPETTENNWGGYYGKEFNLPVWYYTKLCLRRNIRVLSLNPAYVKTKGFQAVIMGIFTGTLYYQLKYDEFSSKFGILFSSQMYLGLSGMAAMPALVDKRQVFYKQRAASFFPTIAYVCAQTVVDVTIAICENIIYANLVYWLVGLAPSAFGVYFGLCILLSLSLSQWFAAIAAIAPNTATAQPLGGMTMVLCVLFSGFIIQRSEIPEGWKFVYWMSPISLAWRAGSINEFRSDLYEKCTYQISELGCPRNVDDGCCAENTDGIFFLKTYAVQTGTEYITIGLCVLFAYFCFSLLLQSYLLSHVRHSSHGSQKAEQEDIEEYEMSVASQIMTSGNLDEEETDDTDIPYTPTTIAFDDIHYYVTVHSKVPHAPDEQLELLSGVTGFAKPATMTALMGSSGAGKTTLLDVLAMRKKTGKIEGTITLNGHSIDPISFTRISGYVEQLDIHHPGPTVEESVDFSASLRLDPMFKSQKKAFCKKLLSLLELTPIADKQVGSLDTGGLSFEQRKRLTMAVELAANPAILFLDEPTSGLDSRAALVVIRATRNIAATGRSVLCTIHQPSYALFSVFDRLLLLTRGGRTVYFGELGEECSSLIHYLEVTADKLGTQAVEHRLPPGANPATWMLAACVAADADFSAAYFSSDLAKRNEMLTRKELEPPEGYVPPSAKSPYVLSIGQQFPILVKRMFISYWRGPSYNVARGMVSILIAVIFGSCYQKERPEATETFSGVLGRVGLFFLATFFMGIIFFSSALTQMSIEREVYYREKASRMYSSYPYTLAFGVAEAPYLIVFSFLHSGVMWGLVDFYKGVDRFFYYYAYYFLYVAYSTFFAQFLIAAFPDQGTAQTIGTAFNTICSSVAGFAITPDKIPDYWIFTYWLAPIHYSLEGIIVTQFHNVNLRIKDLPGTPTVGRYMASHWSDSHFGGYFVYSHRIQNIIILVIFVLVARLGTLYALATIDYTTR